MIRHDWLLKRNCSLSPRQLAFAYAVLCVIALAVAALFFLLYRAWFVFVFTALEIAAVVLAYFQYARHVTDHEHIALLDGCLLVERVEAGRVVQTRLDPYWTRVASPTRMQDLIGLEARGVRVEVGRFVNGAIRRQIAQELRSELRSDTIGVRSASGIHE